MASMVGAPCWPLKYMISDAHDTRLPGTWPKISCVILCVRFSANENGGLSDSTGDCSFHVNDRSKTRADFSAASNDSAEPPWALATAGSRICVPPAAAMAYQTVSRRYLERAVDQFANNYYSELSATHYIATAAANAPFDELKKCCLFQLADEQRHLEMDREVFERAGIPERDWLPAWEAPGTTCRFFRHVLELDDTIEILVKANFVAEGAAGPGTFAVLADGAEARGDVFSAVNHRARVRDETRHISFARVLVKALIDDDPGNLEVIQRWQDESLQLFVEVARSGERRGRGEGFRASYYKIALPLGLRPSTLPV